MILSFLCVPFNLVPPAARHAPGEGGAIWNEGMEQGGSGNADGEGKNEPLQVEESMKRPSLVKQSSPDMNGDKPQTLVYSKWRLDGVCGGNLLFCVSRVMPPATSNSHLYQDVKELRLDELTGVVSVAKKRKENTTLPPGGDIDEFYHLCLLFNKELH